ncbi:AraC family transcriptional regulator [Olivibacter sp. SDN3]|uniref:helix-turn-helix transcriptional regulator n=1 Tax=Olivibacter sp. SDN3 TaxID=2764720 RepID=UPI0016512DC0|nr:helix-turn-helix transcriptional regulator [Olivibacter sp. SDN3]QNL47832.1 AraC family transcriptional regulator [Olivibacter sp. SDN3]
MPFEYYHPSACLTPYLRSYWLLKGGEEGYDVLYPDGCIDIVANLGKKFMVAQKNTVLEENGIYLGGALTEAIYERIPSDVLLLGVRFQPACFGYFYPPYSLSDVKDDCARVSEAMLPPLASLKQNFQKALDNFFLDKLKAYDNPLKKATVAIAGSGGRISLDEIASLCCRSTRQTERLFKQTIGLTPKQFCRIIKFTLSQQLIEAKNPDETLLQVALDAGYYDHAHLSREYKKITRHNPSGK